MILDYSSAAAVILAAMGFTAACLGIFRAGWASAGFFRSASASLGEVLRVQERQAAALERSADLVPTLDRFHAAQEQVGTELRVMSREMRQIRSAVLGETDGQE